MNNSNSNKVDQNKRTPGKYISELNKLSRHGEYLIRIDDLIIARVSPEATETDEETQANAAFICKAVNNYDSMLAELKRLFEKYDSTETGMIIKKSEQ